MKFSKACRLPLKAAEAEAPREQGRTVSMVNRMELPIPMVKARERGLVRDSPRFPCIEPCGRACHIIVTRDANT